MILEEFLNDVKTGDVVWLSGSLGEAVGFVVKVKSTSRLKIIRLSHESPYKKLGAMNRENFPTVGDRVYRLSKFNEYKILKRNLDL